MGNFEPISMKVASTLAANRIVKCSANRTVAYPANATERPIGITTDTVLDTGAALPVKVAGVAKLQFNDTCAAGALVASNNAGQGVPHVDTTAGSYVIGVNIGAAVAATGTISEVLIQPHFKSIP